MSAQASTPVTTTPAPAAAANPAAGAAAPASSPAPGAAPSPPPAPSNADQLALARQMREIATQRQELEQLQAQFKDPASLRRALKAAGHDELKIAEEILLEEADREEKTPEQRELEQFRADKAQREATEAKTKAEQEANKFRVAAEQLMARQEGAIMTAMAENKLPMTPAMAQNLVTIMEDALAAGWDITPAEAALTARAQHVESNRDLYTAMDGDALADALGEAAVKKLIQRHEASLRAKVKDADPERPAQRRSRAPADDRDLSSLSGHDWVDAVLRRR
jgi:hypothetical protein